MEPLLPPSNLRNKIYARHRQSMILSPEAMGTIQGDVLPSTMRAIPIGPTGSYPVVAYLKRSLLLPLALPLGV